MLEERFDVVVLDRRGQVVFQVLSSVSHKTAYIYADAFNDHAARRHAVVVRAPRNFADLSVRSLNGKEGK